MCRGITATSFALPVICSTCSSPRPGWSKLVKSETPIRELADLVPVAPCSGNRDNAGRLVSHDRASVYGRFIELGTHPNIITDGSTRKLENLIVTTIPCRCSRQEKAIWLDRGSTIRRQTGMPWIVLHHVPAKTGSEATGEELEAAGLLVAYRPDYFISGHDHAFAYKSGQSWDR
jgi:Calcineurin-like phosphoesterase